MLLIIIGIVLFSTVEPDKSGIGSPESVNPTTAVGSSFLWFRETKNPITPVESIGRHLVISLRKERTSRETYKKGNFVR